MQKILSMAREKCEAAEVIVFDTFNDIYNVYNCCGNDLMTQRHQEVCLRIIKDGKIGQSYGSYGSDHDILVANAMRSADYGGKADFAFAKPAEFGERQIFDQELADLDVGAIAADGAVIAKYVKERAPDMMLNLYMNRERRKVSVVNSEGLDASYDQTQYTVCLLHMFPGSKEGINHELVTCKYFKMPEEDMDSFIATYNTVQKPVKVPSKRMPVIWRPSSTWALIWRLLVGVNGENVVHGVTPLADKLGEQIFSENFTVYDDPTAPFYPGSVPFDDEGNPTTKKAIVEKGVLKSHIYDQRSGTAKGCGSTGNGFKRSMWGRGIGMAPTPRFTNLMIEPGTMTFEEMLEDAGEAIVITDTIGFHSGNMLKGEYSMNVGIGSYYKDGDFHGRVVDTMVSGNVYSDFKKIKAMGNKVQYNLMSYSPAFYCTDLNVSGTG